jgi:anhydro-N-acetylmuramic acid kinase
MQAADKTDRPDYFVGLMSGTSADAIDVVLVNFSVQPLQLIAHHSKLLPQDIRNSIFSLAQRSDDEIHSMGLLDVALGELFAQTALELITQSGISAKEIVAIGSHGQTIRHSPPNHSTPKKSASTTGFTLQIGDPNIIAERTKITTVADFRRRDMAAGGQGAPLVPAFHRAVFYSADCDRAIVNIGGMANITWLPKQGDALGFDIGPGNVLMDVWIQRHQQKSFDNNGAWASQGKVDETLLYKLLATPFFSAPPPKSTGREAFNLDWLNAQIQQLNISITAVDVQATLLELTALTISDSIKQLSENSVEIFVCGGGAYNQLLMQRLWRHLSTDRSIKLDTTAALGVDAQWVEAMAFAWLARQTLNHQTGNLCAVTGAEREVILGGVYFG